MHLGRIGALLGYVLIILAVAACSGGAASATAPPQPQGERPASGDAGGGQEPGQPADEEPNEQVANDGRLIVYTGSMSVEVAELRPALDQAQAIVVGLGGHLAGSALENDDDSQYATVTYRVPAERWSEALQALRALGTRIMSESTESEDVTDQVVDLDARIANLRVTETAFQSFMDRATTIDEVLKVQSELTTVRGEIERLTAQREALNDRAALGTLAVTFSVPVIESARVSEGWDLGREFDNAVATLVRVGQGLTSLAIWSLVVVLPVVVPLALAVYVAVRLRRRWLAAHPRQTPASPSPAPGTVPPTGPVDA